MARIRTARREEGFTLIESMIAMFFLTFIVAEMAKVTIYAKRSYNLAQRQTNANLLAEESVEKSRNTAYNNIQLKLDYRLPPYVASSGGTTVEEACTGNMDYKTAVANVATCVARFYHPASNELMFTLSRVVRPLATDGVTVTTVTLSNKARIDAIVDFTDAKGNAQAVRVASLVTRF